MLGGGTYSARWGYGVNVKEMCNTLPSCEVCFEKLMSNKYHNSFQECTQCCNWNFNGNFKVTTDYPNDKLDEYNNKSIPCQLLYYEELIKGAMLAYNLGAGTKFAKNGTENMPF